MILKTKVNFIIPELTVNFEFCFRCINKKITHKPRVRANRSPPYQNMGK